MLNGVSRPNLECFTHPTPNKRAGGPHRRAASAGRCRLRRSGPKPYDYGNARLDSLIVLALALA
eukprot:scaffold232956_cov35-Tisochrysis_lutea.AAC.1